MKKALSYLVTVIAVLALSACGHRTSTSLAENVAIPTGLKPKSAAAVLLTENDITNKKYKSIGDIEATVSKWTLFDSDPTRESVNQALREKAAEIGADAVVLVRYGTVGVSLTSWGSMDAKGRAVVFE